MIIGWHKLGKPHFLASMVSILSLLRGSKIWGQSVWDNTNMPNGIQID